MGYSIDQLKKTGTLEGNDTIPVMQGGLTKQVAAGILDNAKIITAAGSQASGIIRREMTYILKNNSSAINFTLNNAVGKKVVNNDYSDDAATATGWIIKVMNVSTRSHVVIVGSNSWDIAKNENMYFFWTGSAWTLHNARMNNVIVDGELQLPNAAAVTSLQATSKLAGLDANGKVNYTTPNAIKDILKLATTTDLNKIETVEDIFGTEGAEYDVNNFTSTAYKIRYGRFYNNTNDYANYHLAYKGWNIIQWVPLTTNATYGYQISYSPVSRTPEFKRYKSNGVWGEWIKITTDYDLNNALVDYQTVARQVGQTSAGYTKAKIDLYANNKNNYNTDTIFISYRNNLLIINSHHTYDYNVQIYAFKLSSNNIIKLYKEGRYLYVFVNGAGELGANVTISSVLGNFNITKIDEIPSTATEVTIN